MLKEKTFCPFLKIWSHPLPNSMNSEQPVAISKLNNLAASIPKNNSFGANRYQNQSFSNRFGAVSEKM